MSSALLRGLKILELLATEPEGLALGDIATRLQLPNSATHRLVTELVETGYVRRSTNGSDYALSLKQISQSLTYLSKIDLVDQAKPSIDRLARLSRGLVRLAIVDDGRLMWVLKSQGATSNIKYDPPMHHDVRLACASSGYAWLSQLSDEKALEIVLRQGIPTEGFGPNAPRTVEQVLAHIHQARSDGYATAVETYEEGIRSLAMPIVNADIGQVTGVVTIAGLLMHMTDEHVEKLIPALREETEILSHARLDYVPYLLPTQRPKQLA
ncbi:MULTISPECIES: IclR family transcriptional regulator [unclassified Arthrobacter]|uniref:IclR family transcriptional regulator n=1 Tax=unclassified Arthrobacter TaxID=235627 RepID=UPI001F358BBA|nr:IclR family transcriptional regulator [Arthrobacter sp. FW305-BF8]UKA54448.1 IclR family transcriptional regulator [Arthrobacter sp. FW305-BF8]